MAEKVKGCKLLEENAFFFKISMNKAEIMSHFRKEIATFTISLPNKLFGNCKQEIHCCCSQYTEKLKWFEKCCRKNCNFYPCKNKQLQAKL